MATISLLPPEMADRIEYVLAQLHGKTQADCVLLADISGQLISQYGTLGHLKVEATYFSALAASDMAATAEMAKMVGEKKRFKLLFHEGERQNVYLSNIGDSFLLVVVFNPTVPIGLVRLYTTQATKKLLPLGEEFETLQTQPGEVIDAGFGDALANELESAFGERQPEE